MFRRNIWSLSSGFEENAKQETNKKNGNMSLVTCVDFHIDHENGSVMSPPKHRTMCELNALKPRRPHSS
jgi:hypothetical protein